ncbi:MAG: hypothetical protein MUC97_06810 [Bernardetiaceae bacterium]|jgi:hypothetical protein|nr:hypothetical protein [Bernardetiaceae bacterium]
MDIHERNMLNLCQLRDIAKSYLATLSTVENPDFRLEQAEYKDEDGTWEIVVSFLVENLNRRTSPLLAVNIDRPYERIYKLVRLDSAKQIIGFYFFSQ